MMVSRTKMTLFASAIVLAAACDANVTEPGSRFTQTTSIANVADGGIVISSTGGGESYVTAPAAAIGVAKWSFSAVQHAGGAANGQFHMIRQRAGFTVDFSGEVTCVAVDPVNHRAWIGGVVTENRSDDPNHSGAIHQPGHDVWFRVVDNGEGSKGSPDRSSVYGFEGAGGIMTSAEYCAAKPWAAGDVNTFEVIEGNIQVRSR